jgi:hypothetical protein
MIQIYYNDKPLVLQISQLELLHITTKPDSLLKVDQVFYL